MEKTTTKRRGRGGEHDGDWSELSTPCLAGDDRRPDDQEGCRQRPEPRERRVRRQLPLPGAVSLGNSRPADDEPELVPDPEELVADDDEGSGKNDH